MSVEYSPGAIPGLPPALLALATVDDCASFADQLLERSRLAEFLDPVGGRNVNQNPIRKQNWERRQSGETMENRFKYVNVGPLADVDDNRCWAQIEGIDD